jgi:hypothetical protein
VPTAVQIVIEVVVFAAATGALAGLGRFGLAVAFAGVAGIREILNYTLDYSGHNLRKDLIHATGRNGGEHVATMETLGVR